MVLNDDSVLTTPQADEKKILLALIGHPVSHSLSPVMHKMAFSLCGITGDYLLLDISPQELSKEMPRLRKLNGFNVTVPHKEAVLPFMDRLTDTARQIGAVNTVRVEENGTFTGHNTDAGGFLKALNLLEATLVDIHATVIGSGGAARAAVWALANAAVASIDIAARNEESACALIDSFTAQNPAWKNRLRWRKPGETSEISVLIVNCTPIGLQQTEPPDWFDAEIKSLRPGGLFFDMVYASAKTTALVETARNSGVRAADGLSMLVGQAALSFEFWTGCRGPYNAMRRAATQTDPKSHID